MKRKQDKTWKWNVVVLGAAVVGVVAIMVGMTNTLHGIRDVLVAKTPDAILASAGISESELVKLPVMYYDQRMDECVNMYDAWADGVLKKRQFEWSECGYNNEQVEQGLVSYELNEQYLPVSMSGMLMPNRGLDMIRWYSAVEGKSEGYAGTLGLQYNSYDAEFIYEEDNFYPLDEVEFSTGDVVNKDGHNHLFTMNFAVPFTVLASGNERFSITADDDTFVYVDDKLVIDMGGIHHAITGEFVVQESGEVYAGIDGENMAYSGVSVKAGEGAMIRIFHADRDSKKSVFDMRIVGMNLSVIDTELADGGDGIQVAYDPNDPSYVPPLGESMVFRPDVTRGLVVFATVEGVVLLMVVVVAMCAVRYLVRRK